MQGRITESTLRHAEEHISKSQPPSRGSESPIRGSGAWGTIYSAEAKGGNSASSSRSTTTPGLATETSGQRRNTRQGNRQKNTHN